MLGYASPAMLQVKRMVPFGALKSPHMNVGFFYSVNPVVSERYSSALIINHVFCTGS